MYSEDEDFDPTTQDVAQSADDELLGSNFEPVADAHDAERTLATPKLIVDAMHAVKTFVTPHMTAYALAEFESISQQAGMQVNGHVLMRVLSMFADPSLVAIVQDEYKETKQSSKLITSLGFALTFICSASLKHIASGDGEPWHEFLPSLQRGLHHILGGQKRSSEIVMFEAFVIIMKCAVPSGFPTVIVNFMRNTLLSDSPNSHLHLLTRLKYAIKPSPSPTPIELEWLKALTYPQDAIAASKQLKETNLTNKMEHPIFVGITDIMKAISACKKNADGGAGLIHAIVLFQLVTGCRMAEALMPSVRFEAVTQAERAEPMRYIKQIGRAKAKKDADFSAVRIIPLLGDFSQVDALKLRATIIKDFISRLQIKNESWTEQDIAGKTQQEMGTLINNMFSGIVGRQVKLLFPKQAAHCDEYDIPFASHFLRAAWVNTHYTLERMNPLTPSRTHFFSVLLGHVDRKSALFYEAVTVTQEFELMRVAPPKKQVKRKTKKEREAEEAKMQLEPEPLPKPAQKRKAESKKVTKQVSESTDDDEEIVIPKQQQKKKKQKAAPQAGGGTGSTGFTISLKDVYGERVNFPVSSWSAKMTRLEIACELMTNLMDHHINPTHETLLMLGVDAEKLGNRGLAALHNHFEAERERVGIEEWDAQAD